MSGTAPLFQVEITKNDQPVTSLPEAVQILDEVGIEMDAVEIESPEDGLWLVGLLGRYGKEAEAGVAVTEFGSIVIDDGISADVQVYVPQP